MTDWNMRTEELKLKDGSTIKNYHYEFNSTDKVLAKIVEDVFKGIMDISADRKTENSSEKPNNCEELNAYRECIKSRSFWDSKHCDGCYFEERCPFDDPKDEPQTDCPWK